MVFFLLGMEKDSDGGKPQVGIIGTGFPTADRLLEFLGLNYLQCSSCSVFYNPSSCLE